jgi:hypothetical protein
MNTLVRQGPVAHPSEPSDWPLKAVAHLDKSSDSSPIGLVMLVVAVVLLFIALRQLRRALVPIAELMRMVLSATLVGVLIFGAAALVVGSTFVGR